MLPKLALPVGRHFLPSRAVPGRGARGTRRCGCRPSGARPPGRAGQLGAVRGSVGRPSPPGGVELFVPSVTELSACRGLTADLDGATASSCPSDLAFHALREYVPGDDLRHVHWRSSAKAGELLVRQYHETRRGHVTILVDDVRASYPRPADFELAVSVAASIALRAVRDDFDTSLRCGPHLARGRSSAAMTDISCRFVLTAADDYLLRSAEEADADTGTGLVVQVTGAARSPVELDAAARRFDPGADWLVVRADSAGEPRVADSSRLRELWGPGPVPPAGAHGSGAAVTSKDGEWVGALVDSAVVVAATLLVLTLLDESFWSRDYLVAGMVPASSCWLWRGRCENVADGVWIYSLGSLVAYAPLGALAALHRPGPWIVPTFDTMNRVLGETFIAPRLFVNTLPPVEASGTLLLLPYAIGFAAAVPAAWLALATRRPLAPMLSILVGLGATILVSVLVPDHYVLRGVVLAVLLVSWAAGRARRAEALVGERRSGVVGAVVVVVVVAAGLGPDRAAGARQRPDGPRAARPDGRGGGCRGC